jgi:hypothetical protein
MEIIIQNIRFVYPGCKLLTKEKFYRSYGDKDINGSKGKPTHHNLNKHNADRVFEALEQAIKDKIEIDKREKEAVKLAKEAAKAKTIEVVKVEKTEPKKKKKATKKPK